MSSFSATSAKRLSTAHPDLQRLFSEVIKRTDCTILCGHRDQAEQDAAFKMGNSKTPWPKSKHNKVPSLAVDAAPYPIDWSDRDGFKALATLVLATAQELGIKVRWGGDWNGNGKADDSFVDMPHFELL